MPDAGAVAASAFRISEIDHLVLRVVDADAMVRFYCDVLGCAIDRRRDDIGLIQLRAGRSLIDLVPVDGELGGAGGAAPGREGRNLDHFCLRLETFDEREIRKHLACTGAQAGETGSRYGADGEGPSIYVSDPEGNIVELKGPPWPAQANPGSGAPGAANRPMPRAAAAEFPIEGGCTCREVRYRMTTKPLFVHCCHCRWCQRETGSAFAINALIETDRVLILQGAPGLIDTPSNSGRGQRIARCRRCQVALWSHYAGAGDALRFVRVGTLDAPDRLPPDIHIFTASRQPWVSLPPGVPAVDEYYDRDRYWSADSLDRRRALIAVERR